jgi:hypothetical protein
MHEPFSVILLFAIGFGLATDCGVFLLSRIKEAYDAGVPNAEAVAIGLEPGRLDGELRVVAVSERRRPAHPAGRDKTRPRTRLSDTT